MDNMDTALYNIYVQPGEVGTSIDESRQGNIAMVNRNLFCPMMIRKQFIFFDRRLCLHDRLIGTRKWPRSVTYMNCFTIVHCIHLYQEVGGK